MTTTLIDWLAARYPQAKKTTLREMVEHKRVRINGDPAKSLRQTVTPNDQVDVLDARSVPMKPHTLDEGLKILYEDAEILIVLKPTGLLTATDEKEQRPTVLKILTDYVHRNNQKAQLHLVHRLDRDASGLLVFARTQPALASLKRQFFYHTVSRQYDVIVHGVPKKPAGRLEHLLLENQFTGEVKPTKDFKKGQLAIMEYQVIAASRAKKLAHLRCTLHTGRKHQIRVQLKAIGHIVCGDVMYGRGDEPPGRLALHAMNLALEHPRTRKRVTFDSAMPGSFNDLLND